MGPVERAVRITVHQGDKLHTPAKGAEFEVARVGGSGIVLLLGKNQAWTPLSWDCLEGIPNFLRPKGWIDIGTKFDTSADSYTLDGYLKTCIKRGTAGWVAVVLERAGVVEIDRGRPARVRLSSGFNSLGPVQQSEIFTINVEPIMKCEGAKLLGCLEQHELPQSLPPIASITKALLSYAEEVDLSHQIPTLNEDATRLVYEDPFAFALAASLDRGIPAEVAWTFPLWIKNQLGHLDPKRIAAMSLEEIDRVLDLLPRRPRYRRDAPRTVLDLARLVVDKTNGDASQLWTGKSSQEVEGAFKQVHGVGPGIASMVVLLLEKVFEISFSDRDHRTMNVKPDVHVIRVLTRLGLMHESHASADQDIESECRRNSSAEGGLAIRVTRRMYPDFPAKLDTALWRIGKNWCHALSPECIRCPVEDVCSKEGVEQT